MARLGLGHAAVARKLNPRIVYCSVSGYGQSGPRRDWPAIDNIVQATSGMMSLGGEPGRHRRCASGFPVVDTLTGQTAAFAIVAALLRRERGGGGDYIDVAMFDATLGVHGLGGGALPRDRPARWSAPATPATADSPPRRCSWRATASASRSASCSSTSSSCSRECSGTRQWLRDPRFCGTRTRASQRRRDTGIARGRVRAA